MLVGFHVVWLKEKIFTLMVMMVFLKYHSHNPQTVFIESRFAKVSENPNSVETKPVCVACYNNPATVN